MIMIVCPVCHSDDFGSIDKSKNDQRIITLNLHFTGIEDTFECMVCEARFEIRLAVKEIVVTEKSHDVVVK